MSKKKWSTCIYCKSQRNESNRFNCEHVINQSFGSYETQAFTIEICKKCNQKFGDTIDLHLARNTYEGQWMRPLFNLKENFNPQKSCRDISISKANNSEKLEIISCGTDGIKVRCPNGQEYILKDNQCFTDSLENEEYLEININCKISKESSRSIAKIAFNYMAYQKGEAFALQECFDPIRDFITNSNGELNQFIRICKDPIIPDSPQGAILANILTLSQEGSLIISSISLLNKIHYRTTLTTNYNGAQIPTSEHLLDPVGKKIEPIQRSSILRPSAVRLIIPPPSMLLVPCFY